MSKKKMNLAENPACLQFVEQDFPVVEEKIGDTKWTKVKVISCNGKSPYLCHFFKVEVVKDYNGFITFFVVGEGEFEGKGKDGFNPDIRIMRTDDFNRAYDLKNKLDNLLGENFIPNEKIKMHCYGSLQREKLMWE